MGLVVDLCIKWTYAIRLKLHPQTINYRKSMIKSNREFCVFYMIHVSEWNPSIEFHNLLFLPISSPQSGQICTMSLALLTQKGIAQHPRKNPNEAINMQEIHVNAPTLYCTSVLTVFWQYVHLVTIDVSARAASDGGWDSILRAALSELLVALGGTFVAMYGVSAKNHLEV